MKIIKKIFVIFLIIVLSSSLYSVGNNPKNQKQCPFCKKMNPEEAEYCLKCGRKFPKLQKNVQEIKVTTDTYEDNLRFMKYVDWKNELSSAEDNAEIGYYFIGFGLAFILLAAVVPKEKFSDSGKLGMAGLGGGLGIIGLVVVLINKGNINELEEIGKRNNWTYSKKNLNDEDAYISLFKIKY